MLHVLLVTELCHEKVIFLLANSPHLQTVRVTPCRFHRAKDRGGMYCRRQEKFADKGPFHNRDLPIFLIVAECRHVPFFRSQVQALQQVRDVVVRVHQFSTSDRSHRCRSLGIKAGMPHAIGDVHKSSPDLGFLAALKPLNEKSVIDSAGTANRQSVGGRCRLGSPAGRGHRGWGGRRRC